MLTPFIPFGIVTRVPQPPRWYYHRVTPRIIDEGEDLVFTIKCTDAVVGARVILWMTGGGSMGGTPNWLRSWSDVVQATVEAAGCAYMKLSSTTTPKSPGGTVAWLITITQAYIDLSGTNGAFEMIFQNTVRRNLRNNATNPGDIRGGPGSYQILLAAQSPTAQYGTVAAGTPRQGNFVDVRDTSRKPEGIPVVTMSAKNSPATLSENSEFYITITGVNIVVGTVLKIYAANEGQNSVTPSFRSAIEDAAENALLESFLVKYSEANKKEYFNGAYITFTEAYEEDNMNIALTVDVGLKPGSEQFDVILQVFKEGDAAEFETVTGKGDWVSDVVYHPGEFVTYFPTGRVFIFKLGVEPAAGSPPTDDSYENSLWRFYNRTQISGSSITKIFKPRPINHWKIGGFVRNNGIAKYRLDSPFDYNMTPLQYVDLVSKNTPSGWLDMLESYMPQAQPPTLLYTKTEKGFGDWIYAGVEELYDYDSDTYKIVPFYQRLDPFYASTEPFTEKKVYEGKKIVQTLLLIKRRYLEGFYDEISGFYSFKEKTKSIIIGERIGGVNVFKNNREIAGEETWRLGTFSRQTVTYQQPLRIENIEQLPDNCHRIKLRSYFNRRFEDEQRSAQFMFAKPDGYTGVHELILEKPSGDSYNDANLDVPTVTVYYTKPPLPYWPANIHGINIAGGEFGDTWDEKTGERSLYGGGRYYYPAKPEHTTPSKRYEQMNYFYNEGVRLLRLPIKWERVQRQLFGELYYGDNTPFTATSWHDMRRIIDVVNYWTNTLGGRVLLDVHNYMSYATGVLFNGKKWVKQSYKVGSPELPVAALTDLWVRLDGVFGTNPKIEYGIMNEPSGTLQTARNVAATMQTVMNELRQAGAVNRIVITGSGYSNAKKWVETGVAEAFDDIYDPYDNFAIEVHNYIDPNQSGTSKSCVIQIAEGTTERPINNDLQQLYGVTGWARRRGFKMILGEFNGGNPSLDGTENCGPSITAVYKFIMDNADVWESVTPWAAGFPTNYMFAMDPSNANYVTGTRSPNMALYRPLLLEGLKTL